MLGGMREDSALFHLLCHFSKAPLSLLPILHEPVSCVFSALL